MIKYIATFALAGMFALNTPSAPVATTGSWQIDTRYSDAKLVTDATTDYGKTKINTTLGFARIRGTMNFDASDPTKSKFDFSVYPATAMKQSIDENGNFLNSWLANLSNQTLICFHSKSVEKMADGRLKATGDLVLTRVDRNVQATASEAYAGPVYGPPEIHRVTREATFLFNSPSPGKDAKDGTLVMSGSTNMFREDFPQLVRAALSTYWPLVFQNENCEAPNGTGEDYHGTHCTGMLLQAASLPEPPIGANAEDVGTASTFNSIVGNRLSISVHLRLLPKANGGAAAAGN
jgi:polyisoprenoid-binding protein YceI